MKLTVENIEKHLKENPGDRTLYEHELACAKESEEAHRKAMKQMSEVLWQPKPKGYVGYYSPENRSAIKRTMKMITPEKTEKED